MKKECPACKESVSKHFFYGEMCVACAAKSGSTASVDKKENDYEVVEDNGCAGGGCTL